MARKYVTEAGNLPSYYVNARRERLKERGRLLVRNAYFSCFSNTTCDVDAYSSEETIGKADLLFSRWMKGVLDLSDDAIPRFATTKAQRRRIQRSLSDERGFLYALVIHEFRHFLVESGILHHPWELLRTKSSKRLGEVGFKSIAAPTAQEKMNMRFINALINRVRKGEKNGLISANHADKIVMTLSKARWNTEAFEYDPEIVLSSVVPTIVVNGEPQLRLLRKNRTEVYKFFWRLIWILRTAHPFLSFDRCCRLLVPLARIFLLPITKPDVLSKDLRLGSRLGTDISELEMSYRNFIARLESKLSLSTLGDDDFRDRILRAAK